MLGHLKAEDFVNLLEGLELPAKHKAHLDACLRCRSTWDSMRPVHSEMTSMESEIPEPDWALFRSSVRDELLSRSIQRESSMRRWTGWAVRPAVAWALSLLMAVGITTVTVLWKIDNRAPAPPAPTAIQSPPAIEPAIEVVEAGPEKSLFDDVVSLGEEEQRQFRQLLESSRNKGGAYRQ